MKTRVILDMDVGVDDAIALILALNSMELDILALSTVSGNVSARMAAVNALKVSEALGKSIKVIKGLSIKGYRRSKHAIDVHGLDGLGDSNLPNPKGKAIISKDPIKRIADIIKASDSKVTLVCTAPLTNIARLLTQEDIRSKLDKIVLMGGVYDYAREQGNVTRHAEFNFYLDPKAASIVMGSDVSIVACGLDLTSRRDCAVDASILAKIKGIDSIYARLASTILERPVARFGYFNLHDVFALFAVINEGLFTTAKAYVKVIEEGREKGRCVTTYASDGNVTVCKDIDAKGFMDMLFKRLS